MTVLRVRSNDQGWLITEQLLLLRYVCFLMLLLTLTLAGAAMVGASGLSNDNNTDLFGRLVLDANDSGIDLSAARQGFEKGISPEFYVKVEVDFSHSVPEADNAFFALGKQRQFRIGKQKIIRGLSAATSSLHSSFISRPKLFRLTGGLERNIGVYGQFEGSNWLVQPGVFFNESFRGYLGTVRSVYRPRASISTNWHVGASAQSSVVRNNPDGIASGRHELLLGLEGLIKNRNWYLATEVIKRITGTQRLSGFYADFGFLIWGKVLYSESKAALSGRRINAPLSAGGLGAFEIAARHERISITAGGDKTGAGLHSELSLIWYLEDTVRVIFDRRFDHKVSMNDDQNRPKFRARVQISF